MPQIPQINKEKSKLLFLDVRGSSLFFFFTFIIVAQELNISSLKNYSISDNETKYTPKNKSLVSQTSCEDDDEHFFNPNIKKPIQRKIPAIASITEVNVPKVPIMKTTATQNRQLRKQDSISEKTKLAPDKEEQQRINNKNTLIENKIDNNYQTQEETHQSRLNTFRPIVPARKIETSQMRSKSHGVANAPERFSIMRDLKKRNLAISNTLINRSDATNKQSSMNANDNDSDDSEFSSMRQNKNNSLLPGDQHKGARSRSNNDVNKIASSNNNNQIHSNNSKVQIDSSTPKIAESKKLLATLENDKKDGTLSDSALTTPLATSTNESGKKRRPSMAKALVILGLSKKSTSSSNITYCK